MSSSSISIKKRIYRKSLNNDKRKGSESVPSCPTLGRHFLSFYADHMLSFRDILIFYKNYTRQNYILSKYMYLLIYLLFFWERMSILINNITFEKKDNYYQSCLLQNPLEGSSRISSKFGRQVELLLFFPLKGAQVGPASVL